MRTTALSLLVLALATAAFAAPEDAAAPEPTPDVSFAGGVMPLLGSTGCNATQGHGSPTGKGGLKLSMFGADPKQDYTALTRSAEGRRINRVEPLKSLLLKATAGIEHGGKQRIEPGTPQYDVLVSWLTTGAPRDDAGVPTIESIEVSPKEMTLAEGRTQQLSATAVFSDGSRRHVTRAARYQSSDKAVATAEKAGEVRADGFGQAFVVVTCNRRSAVARVAVPQTLSPPFSETPVNNKIDELVLARLEEQGRTGPAEPGDGPTLTGDPGEDPGGAYARTEAGR